MHSGTPCTAFSILGKRKPQQADWDLLQFTIDVAIHQSFQGLLMSVENLTSSALWVQPRWLEHFGSRPRPMLPWRFFASDGCQHGQISPGIHEDGQPFLKGQTWMANYSLADVELRCKQPFLSLLGRFHTHRPIWGSVLTETGSVSTAAYSGRYPAPLCFTIARCAQAAVRDQRVVRRAAWRTTPITEMAHQYSQIQAPAVAAALAPVPCSFGEGPSEGPTAGSTDRSGSSGCIFARGCHSPVRLYAPVFTEWAHTKLGPSQQYSSIFAECFLSPGSFAPTVIFFGIGP